MRAAQRDRYGPPEVVEVREIDRPEPTDDRVLVKVHAASVNRADLDALYPRWAFARLFLGLRRPRLPGVGLDIAGVVESVGPDVTGFAPGDQVFADLFAHGANAFSEYVAPREKALATMPEGLSFEESATLPHSALLAVQALGLRKGPVTAGARILVVGASGNVGPFVVQIAKAQGAEVTAVASTGKLDFVRSLGADHVIDYTTTDASRTGERYDRIIDVDAHHHVGRWRGSLRSHGVYVALGGSGGWIVSALVEGPAIRLASGRQMGLMLDWRPFDPGDVEILKGLLANGAVKPLIDRRFPLDEVVEALRYMESGEARGKVIVTF